jgi:HD superfamily phosphohydrolase
MPKWGLTSQMRREQPYGLDPALLRPGKVITDPVHGDIRVTELERMLIDSPPFQRLRRVKQLGSTHLVYPGATHTRFSHSLGTVAAAQMLLDIVLEQRDEPGAKPDLFGQWEQEAAESGPAYLTRVAEAIVLTRLGALLHDLCHIPFGHSVEDELQLLRPHDENEARLAKLWAQLDPEAREAIDNGVSLTGKSLKADVTALILSGISKPKAEEEGQDPGVAPITYPFAQDIVGNTISADLMDYLSRDHRFTGLPAALGHRFLDSMYVSRSDDPFKAERMVLRVVRSRRERKDTLTELLKYLRYRYELSERALAHHAKLAADAMVGKLLSLYHDALWVAELDRRAAGDQQLASALEGVDRGDLDALRTRAKGHLKAAGLHEVDDSARDLLEDVLLRHGDDGLLERLREEGERLQEDARWRGVGQLAAALLDRRLFKPTARMSKRSHAKRLWQDFGRKPDERRRVEQAAARFAGIEPGWHAVLWIPPEKMRLKPALVLVDDDEMIDTMLRREVNSGHGRGSDIYESHRDLWAFEVFVHPDVREDDVARDALLAAIAEQLHIKGWDGDGGPVSVAKVARRQAAEQLALSRAEEQELKGLVPAFYKGSVGVGPQATLEAMTDEYRLAWEAAHEQAAAQETEAPAPPDPGKASPGAADDANNGGGSQERLM